MRRCGCAVLCGLFLALATHAVAGAPAPWYRIAYDNRQADLWSCQDAKGNTPRDFMYLADTERRAYRMEDVEEQGQVVETTMVGSFFHAWLIPTPREGKMTWYRGKERCEKALRALRDEAQRERQRREKYR